MLRRPADAPPPLGPVERHRRRRALPSRLVGPDTPAPAVVPRLGRTRLRPIGPPPPAGAGGRHGGHCDALRPPRRPPGRAGSRDSGRGRLLRTGDRAVARRGRSACSGAWTPCGAASREPPGGRRRGLPLARPSERTGLRHPFDRRSGQSRRTGGRPGARQPGAPGRPTEPSTSQGIGLPGALRWPDGLSDGRDRHRRRPDARGRGPARRGPARRPSTSCRAPRAWPHRAWHAARRWSAATTRSACTSR